MMNTTRFFGPYYNNAEVNAIMILDCSGTVLDVNKAFTNNFGYSNEEIAGKNFSILFTDRDKEKNKPQLELEIVASRGQAHDENYVLDKRGHAIWCTGESILVDGSEGEKYIVKDIVNLQAKKQLQLFLVETEELLERIFESSRDIPMMIMDGSMKIERVNSAFLELFEINDIPASGTSLAGLHHPFWNDTGIKREISKIIITNEPLRNREFLLDTKSGDQKLIKLDSKIIDLQQGFGRKIFIILEDITAEPKAVIEHS